MVATADVCYNGQILDCLYVHNHIHRGRAQRCDKKVKEHIALEVSTYKRELNIEQPSILIICR